MYVIFSPLTESRPNSALVFGRALLYTDVHVMRVSLRLLFGNSKSAGELPVARLSRIAFCCAPTDTPGQMDSSCGICCPTHWVFELDSNLSCPILGKCELDGTLSPAPFLPAPMLRDRGDSVVSRSGIIGTFLMSANSRSFGTPARRMGLICRAREDVV